MRTIVPNDYQEANGFSTQAAYRDGQGMSIKNTPKPSSERLLPRIGPPRPYQMPNQEMLESAYAKRHSENRSALLLQWVWPPMWSLRVRYESMTYHQCLMQLAHSTTLKWSPASHMRTASYDDARSESSHHCPKSRRGIAVAMTSRLSALGRLIQQ